MARGAMTRQAAYQRRLRAERVERGECIDYPWCGGEAGHAPRPGRRTCQAAADKRRAATERRLGRTLRSRRGRPPRDAASTDAQDT